MVRVDGTRFAPADVERIIEEHREEVERGEWDWYEWEKRFERLAHADLAQHLEDIERYSDDHHHVCYEGLGLRGFRGLVPIYEVGMGS